MKKTILIFAIVIPMLFTSCDLLLNNDVQISEAEIIDGLKRALKIGSDTSCASLNKEDAYFKNDIIKILLPPEADLIFANKSSFGIFEDVVDAEIEKVILSINRSAEDAADEAKPIFIDAITNMTVVDGLEILNGTNFKDSSTTEFDSTAATHYLDLKTRVQLTEVFSPIIDSALNKSLTKGLSTNDLWANLIFVYNGYAVMYNKPLINTELTLGQHATAKALDGLFYVVGNEEKKIRLDPFQWADDILQKVFSSVGN